MANIKNHECLLEEACAFCGQCFDSEDEAIDHEDECEMNPESEFYEDDEEL
jgi:hypothetical protein